MTPLTLAALRSWFLRIVTPEIRRRDARIMLLEAQLQAAHAAYGREVMQHDAVRRAWQDVLADSISLRGKLEAVSAARDRAISNAAVELDAMRARADSYQMALESLRKAAP